MMKMIQDIFPCNASVASYLHAYMSFLGSQKNTGTPKHRGRGKKKNIKQEI